MWKLVVLFTVLPALELYLLLQIGSAFGALETVLLIVVTGIVGGWLAKREGLRVLSNLTEQLGQGLPPATKLVEGALVVAGGLLLVTPGVITDLAGFAFILAPTRRLLAPVVLRSLTKRFAGSVQVGGSFAGGAPPPTAESPFSGAPNSGPAPHPILDDPDLFDHP